MKILENITKLPDGGKVKFRTYIWSDIREAHFINWTQIIQYCPAKKRKWQQAIKNIHYTDEDLKYQRSEFCDLLKNEVING